jgi:hypothetical protein
MKERVDRRGVMGGVLIPGLLICIPSAFASYTLNVDIIIPKQPLESDDEKCNLA